METKVIVFWMFFVACLTSIIITCKFLYVQLLQWIYKALVENKSEWLQSGSRKDVGRMSKIKLSKKQKKFIKKKRDKDREQLAMIRIQNEGKKK